MRQLQLAAFGEPSEVIELNTDYRDLVLDLKDVSVIDRDVMHFFVRCEADGVNLENCPAYVREWMEREKD